MINPDDVTIMVDKSNFDNKQYKADLQSAYECGFVFGANDVLEKIKAEIKDLDLGFFDEDYRAGVARGIMEFNKILNKHIAELKGENK